MADLADGESLEVQGSAKEPYVLKNTGGVYSCTCPAWRHQGGALDKRTCKHLKKLRGDKAEADRIGSGAIVIWLILEDRQLVNTSAICPGDPRYIRRRGVLSSPGSSLDLTWSDGSSAGRRVVASIPHAEFAQLRLEKT